MEVELKIQAAIAVGMLRTVSLANAAFDYMGEALRTVEGAVLLVTSGQSDTADERLASVRSIALTCREVVDLEFEVEAAIKIINRWMEQNQTGQGLDGLPAAAWRVRQDELVPAVVRARQKLELASASCYHASAVLDMATLFNFPSVYDAWIKDGKQALVSTIGYLNEAHDSLTKMCAAAVGARDAAKLLIDLL